MIPRLVQAGYRVVAPDMRGYGFSDKPKSVADYRVHLLVQDCVELLEMANKEGEVEGRSQPLPPPTLVAHDWGGVVAWNLAQRHPDSIGKLVILNSPHPSMYQALLRTSPVQLMMAWYVFYFQLPLLPELMFTLQPFKAAGSMFRTRNNSYGQLDKEIIVSSWLIPGAMTAMLNYYRAFVRGIFSRALSKKNSSARARDEKIKVPTLVVWGKNDGALSQKLAQGLDKYVENVQVHLLDGVSHWVPAESPDLAAQKIIDFLLVKD